MLRWRVLFLGCDLHERLTNMANQARADRRQFLEHLILRAEAVWNFQPPPPPLPRPWWKLWGKDPRAGTAGHRGRSTRRRLTI